MPPRVRRTVQRKQRAPVNATPVAVVHPMCQTSSLISSIFDIAVARATMGLGSVTQHRRQTQLLPITNPLGEHDPLGP